MTDTDGLGHYWRGRDGIWRYTLSGEPVPGARPRTRFDREHPLPRVTVDAVRYAVVPDWMLEGSAELAELCGREGVLVEEAHGTLLRRFLVPVALLPTDPDPQGGMWAPELEPEELLGTRDLAEYLGYSPASIYPMLAKGLLPGPVLRRRVRGQDWGYWTRPVLDQWRARYREARPLRYDVTRKLATERRRKAAREVTLASLGRKPIRRRRA